MEKERYNESLNSVNLCQQIIQRPKGLPSSQSLVLAKSVARQTMDSSEYYSIVDDSHRISNLDMAKTHSHL